MLTIITATVCGIIMWFDAFKAMNASITPEAGHWSTLVYYITKYMRYPFIAFAIDMVLVIVLAIIGGDAMQDLLWDLGIYF